MYTGRKSDRPENLGKTHTFCLSGLGRGGGEGREAVQLMCQENCKDDRRAMLSNLLGSASVQRGQTHCAVSTWGPLLPLPHYRLSAENHKPGKRYTPRTIVCLCVLVYKPRVQVWKEQEEKNWQPFLSNRPAHHSFRFHRRLSLCFSRFFSLRFSYTSFFSPFFSLLNEIRDKITLLLNTSIAYSFSIRLDIIENAM